jgi:hypothetical protein
MQPFVCMLPEGLAIGARRGQSEFMPLGPETCMVLNSSRQQWQCAGHEGRVTSSRGPVEVATAMLLSTTTVQQIIDATEFALISERRMKEGQD